MGVDALLCVIVVSFFGICGGFGSYGCYRCFTDKAESRVHSEDSLKKKDLYKCQKKPKIFSLFRNRDQYSRNSSSTSFTGTIYTVSSASEFCRETDGKVPFDLLRNPTISNMSSRVADWRLQNDLAVSAKDGERAATAPY